MFAFSPDRYGWIGLVVDSDGKQIASTANEAKEGQFTMESARATLVRRLGLNVQVKS